MAAVTDHLSTPKPSSEAYQRASASADFIRSKLPSHLQKPRVAIVCGSGLGGIADTVTADTKLEIDYHDIPNFPKTTGEFLQGHAGKLVVGTMGDTKVPVVLLVGRAHFYEGHTMELVTFATRVCKVLGVETMIVTNAAGGLNPDYSVGDIVCLNDHLNMAGLVGFHPLRGPNADDFGVRFPPLSDAYDLGLRQKAHQTWQKVRPADGKRKLHEGV
ncbi:purine nucleoside phosphorylase-like protein, partial [Aureobasidium melanogenum]